MGLCYLVWRRIRDSNPGALSGCRFSRPVQSTTLPTLQCSDCSGNAAAVSRLARLNPRSCRFCAAQGGAAVVHRREKPVAIRCCTGERAQHPATVRNMHQAGVQGCGAGWNDGRRERGRMLSAPKSSRVAVSSIHPPRPEAKAGSDVQITHGPTTKPTLGVG